MNKENTRILISGCLLGINCKYNGQNNINEELASLLKDYTLIPVCPEQLGGLTTPRLKTEIFEGSAKDVLIGHSKAVNEKGEDVSANFILGALETLKIAKMYNCTAAVLKERSPSCGYGTIYDGNFNGSLKEGNGIAAQILLDAGIKIYNETNFRSLLTSLT